MVKQALALYKRLLLMDCVDLEASSRDSIMLDFDCGADYIQFEVTVKFGQHKQLPLILAVLNHDDEEEARTGAQSAIEQFERTKGSEGMHPHVAEIMKAEADFRMDLDRFAAGAVRAVCHVMLAEASPWNLLRVNEVSVERLHRLGTM